MTVLGGVAYWYRPLPDVDGHPEGPSRRDKQLFISTSSMADDPTAKKPLLYDLSQRMWIGIITSASRFFLKNLNDFEIKEDEHYRRFLACVEHREKDVPLITVANHTSILDEPVITSSILPLKYNFMPEKLRWNICTQEMCFFNGIVSSIFGACNSLPIRRGIGINQKLFFDFSRHIAIGDWIHLFPEAGCYQLHTLGGRFYFKPHEVREKGRLKWGVGKLIAHSPQKPIVIPWHHTGMESVLRQDRITNDVIDMLPRTGNYVTVRFGPEIDFSDLIEEYEAKVGHPIRKLSRRKQEDPSENFHDFFDSSALEYELYHKITSRLEEGLMALEKQAKKEVGDRWVWT